MELKNEYPVILFDGVCNLCNGFVQFIIKKDKKNIFRFGALQSETVQDYTSEKSLDKPGGDTVILVEGSGIYIKSRAVFRIVEILGGWLKVFLVFRIFPARVTDGIYDFVARNRYRIFGRRNECMVPTEEVKEKFLD